MHTRGITVEILRADGEPFQEYKDPLDSSLTDTDGMTHALIEIPAPEADQHFSIRYYATDGSYFEENGVSYEDKGLEFRFLFKKTEPEVIGDASGLVDFEPNWPVTVSSIGGGSTEDHDIFDGVEIRYRIKFSPMKLCEQPRDII